MSVIESLQDRRVAEEKRFAFEEGVVDGNSEFRRTARDRAGGITGLPQTSIVEIYVGGRRDRYAADDPIRSGACGNLGSQWLRDNRLPSPRSGRMISDASVMTNMRAPAR